MLEKDEKLHIRITTKDEKEQMAIGNAIHMQLAGNKDYIDNNIILNIDECNEINVYIFEECIDVPTIVI